MRSDFYPKDLKDPGRIRAGLDFVSPYGTVEGWAIYTESLAVCHVQICLDDVVLGEDLADKFRPDLLQAGLRHGYCAFYATIPDIRPGVHSLKLVDARTGNRIHHIGEDLVKIPVFDRRRSRNVDRQGWTDEQILSQSACIGLDKNCHGSGVERYIDNVFRFALGRWADPEALMSYGAALLAKTITPTEVFRSVMTSAERKAQTRRLPSIFDHDFLFDLELTVLE